MRHSALRGAIPDFCQRLESTVPCNHQRDILARFRRWIESIVSNHSLNPHTESTNRNPRPSSLRPTCGDGHGKSKRCTFFTQPNTSQQAAEKRPLTCRYERSVRRRRGRADRAQPTAMRAGVPVRVAPHAQDGEVLRSQGPSSLTQWRESPRGAAGAAHRLIRPNKLLHLTRRLILEFSIQRFTYRRAGDLLRSATLLEVSMRTKAPLSSKYILELKRFTESALSAYLKGKLPPKEVAQKLATHMEVEAASEVLDQLVHDGRIAREEANSIIQEFRSARSVENSIAATTGVAAGGTAVLTMVSTSGTIAGLSATGITSGLAALGALVGGGMAAGLLVSAGGAVVVGASIFWGTKQVVRRTKKLLEAKRSAQIG